MIIRVAFSLTVSTCDNKVTTAKLGIKLSKHKLTIFIMILFAIHKCWWKQNPIFKRQCAPFLTLLLWLQLCISSFISSSFSFSAATCASYNFSFLSPQGLNFSSQSSAPFWSGTLSFLLSFLAPVVFLYLINCNIIISPCALNLITSSLWCSFHIN